MIEARTIHSAEAPRFALDQPPVFEASASVRSRHGTSATRNRLNLSGCLSRRVCISFPMPMLLALQLHNFP